MKLGKREVVANLDLRVLQGANLQQELLRSNTISDLWVPGRLVVTVVGLTEGRDYRKTRKNDDPISLGPQHPTTVDNDKITQDTCHREKQTGANEDARQVCESLHACGILQWCSETA